MPAGLMQGFRGVGCAWYRLEDVCRGYGGEGVWVGG
jgi:hypothetical protein